MSTEGKLLSLLQGWDKPKLKSRKTRTTALINTGYFPCPLRAMATLLKVNERTIRRNLERLLQKGLIQRERVWKMYWYRAMSTDKITTNLSCSSANSRATKRRPTEKTLKVEVTITKESALVEPPPGQISTARNSSPPGRTCDIAGCDTKHYGSGYCQKHFRRWKRHGDPAKVLAHTGGKAPTYNEDRTSKVCIRCGQMVSLDDYWKSKTSLDGRRSWCISCQKTYWDETVTPEKRKEYSKRYYKNNPHKCVERSQKWNRENPERVNERAKRYKHERRARQLANGGPNEINDFIYSEECFYCKKPVSKDTRTIDHFIPLVANGTNELSNLRTACRSCNCSKQAKIGADFFGWVIEKVVEREQEGSVR